MLRFFTAFCETTGGLLLLLRLGFQTRFRMSGGYWRWRNETAFGGGEPTPAEKRKAIVHYARWMWRMRRFS